MNKRAVGTEWESRAAEYLAARGVQIVERNFRCRQGEIDLIGYQGECLVFVEVKYRGTVRRGYALDAVDYRKQYKICRVADYYRYLHRLGENVTLRYDVIGIQGGEVQWIQNAFPHVYVRRDG